MKTRESFNNKWGFILACIGSAVGMGNIWMFPTRVSMYGGGSYLIPYFIFVVLIGFTGVIGEMSFGRATRSGPIDAFGIAMERKGKRKLGELLGGIPVLGALAMAIGYTVVMGWILKYMIGAFTGSTLSPADIDGFSAEFGGMASAFGNNMWQIIALVIGIVILMFGVGNGIEKANKILMPAFFVLFIILAIYAACQPGAIDGYKYIFRIEPKVLADPKTWIFALGQAFFSVPTARTFRKLPDAWPSSIPLLPCLQRLSSYLPWRLPELSSTREVPDCCSSSCLVCSNQCREDIS